MNIVITTNHLAYFGGSEMVALEIAEYFASCGNKVTLITNYFENPLKTLTTDEKYKKIYPSLTITDDWNTYIDLENLDLLWIQHQLIPPQFLKMFCVQNRKKPYVVFHHMSSTQTIELPLLNRIELALADKVFSVSVPLKEALQNYGFQGTDIEVFPNLAPKIFLKTKIKKSWRLRKIAVVSNHPPKELLDATIKLRRKNLVVEIYGLQSKFQRITPGVLRKYDLVITIGKTVQYCLVMGHPVFVYDHFGGPGYLNDNNFRLASRRNFCGKGFTTKNAKELTKLIIEGYQTHVRYMKRNNRLFKSKYDLESRLSRLKRARPKVKTLSIEDAFAAEMVCATIRDLYRHVHLEYKDLHRIITQQKQEINSLNKLLKTNNNKLNEFREKVNVMADSKLWRYGSIVVNPLKKILHKTNNTRNI